MNNRELFNRIMNYQHVKRLPILAVEPYEKTAIERWKNEGLTPEKTIEDALGMAKFVKVPIRLGPNPRFEYKKIYEDSESIIETDTTYGATVKKLKIAPSMYYGYLDHQVKTFDDWKRIKYRYEGTVESRLPNDLNSIIEKLNNSTNPVVLEIFPYFFRLGFYLMGMEGFMLAFYDQPELIHDMFSFWNSFVIKNIKPYISKVKVDCLVLAEDLAYNNGPHLSLDIYKEFWFPYQDLLIKEVKKYDTKNICLWTAGDIDVMIPTLMDHGVNCIWPIERCSTNMDPILLRKKYGKQLKMHGGIPKRCLVEGKDSIDKEINKLITLIKDGGFIPALDDMVSPEVPLKHYQYYIKRLSAIKI